MARAIVMPSMGMYTEEGVLTAWLRATGSRVAVGEPVAEITTEKATFEIPAPEEGTLHAVASVGTTLRVQSLMGYILQDGEALPDQSKTSAASEIAASTSAPLSPDINLAPPAVGPLRATPVAKRLAAQYNIDLRQVKGSGPGGRIVEADIQPLIARRAPVVPISSNRQTAERILMTGSRRSLADRLRNTLSTAASTTLSREADADLLVATRQRLIAKLGQAPSFDALFIKLFAAALRDHPDLNAVIEGESIVNLAETNVGFAVAVPNGLIVPVVPNADSAPFGNIVETVKNLTARALAGRLQPGDLEGGTATISNLGAYGIDVFTPILNGSQSVILGIGRIVQRPVVRDAQLAVGYTCALSLTFDHRVTDGVPAAVLLDTVVRLMNDEDFLSCLA